MQAKLDAAQRAHTDAKARLAALPDAILDELCETEAPTAEVQRCVSALCIIFELPKVDLATAQARLMPDGLEFRQRLLGFDASKLPTKAATRLRDFAAAAVTDDVRALPDTSVVLRDTPITRLRARVPHRSFYVSTRPASPTEPAAG